MQLVDKESIVNLYIGRYTLFEPFRKKHIEDLKKDWNENHDEDGIASEDRGAIFDKLYVEAEMIWKMAIYGIDLATIAKIMIVQEEKLRPIYDRAIGYKKGFEEAHRELTWSVIRAAAKSGVDMAEIAEMVCVSEQEVQSVVEAMQNGKDEEAVNLSQAKKDDEENGEKESAGYFASGYEMGREDGSDNVRNWVVGYCNSPRTRKLKDGEIYPLIIAALYPGEHKKLIKETSSFSTQYSFVQETE
jgi:hypothetical protein